MKLCNAITCSIALVMFCSLAGAHAQSNGKTTYKINGKTVGQEEFDASTRAMFNAINGQGGGGPAVSFTYDSSKGGVPSAKTKPNTQTRAVIRPSVNTQPSFGDSINVDTRTANPAAWSPIIEAIAECRTYRSVIQGSEPMIQVAVANGVGNGKCKYTQTVSSTSTYCLLTEQQRQEIHTKGSTEIERVLKDPAICGEAAAHEIGAAAGTVASAPEKPAAPEVKTTTHTDAKGNVTTTTDTNTSGMQAHISITQTPEEAVATKEMGDGFSKAIGACTPFEKSMPHPMMSQFTVTMKVHGMKGGKCKFTQTLPNNGMHTCLVTDAQRKNIQEHGAEAMQKVMMDNTICEISGYGE